MIEHTIDVTGEKLGRVASKIAMILMGKDNANYSPNVIVPMQITIENVDKLALSDKKLGEKEYQRYSGYPGGRTVFTMKDVVAKHGAAEVLRLAIRGMLPNNKLRTPRLKNLIIK